MTGLSQAVLRRLARMPAWAVWAVAGGSVLLQATAIGVLGTNPGEQHVVSLGKADIAWTFGFLLMPPLGALVATRRRDNLVGWLLLFTGAFDALAQAGQAYSAWALVRAPGSLPAGEVIGWATVPLWAPQLALIVTVFALFPTGRPLGRIWAGIVLVVLATSLVIAVAIAIDTWHLRGRTLLRPDADGYVGSLSRTTVAVLYPLVLGGALLTIASLIVRYRRARGVERLQMKWLMVAAFVAIPAILLDQIPRLDANAKLALSLVNSPATPLLAVAMAILQYRLYDIDRIISRTVSYAVLTGLVVAVYAGTVTLATQVLPLRSTYAVAAATLAAVAVANPLRRRLQSAVDRRFNRARYDATRTVEAFADRLRTEVDLDDVRTDLLTAVQHTVQPTHAALWLRANR